MHAADATQAVAHELGLRRELRATVDVLELASPARSEVRAVGLDARRRSLDDRFDRSAQDAPADLGDADGETVSRRRVRHEQDLAGHVREAEPAVDELLDPRLDEVAGRESGDQPIPCFAASLAFFLSCFSLIERLGFFFSFELRSPLGIVFLLAVGRDGQKTTTNRRSQDRSPVQSAADSGRAPCANDYQTSWIAWVTLNVLPGGSGQNVGAGSR